jgi:hypothetical protein
MLNMDIHFRFDRIKTFCTFIPTHPPSKSLYCTFNWDKHVVVKGCATWFVHHCICEIIRITNRDVWILERKLMMLRCQYSVAPPHIWCNNHSPHLQLQILGTFHQPNPKYNLIMEIWELKIGPMITWGEAQKTWWLFWNYTKCSTFNLKKLG